MERLSSKKSNFKEVLMSAYQDLISGPFLEFKDDFKTVIIDYLVRLGFSIGTRSCSENL